MFAKRICTIINRDIAHLDRRRRRRITNFDEIYGILQKLVTLFAKYGDMLGVQVADDLSNFIISYDWMAVFDLPWRRGSWCKIDRGLVTITKAGRKKPRQKMAAESGH